MVQGAKSGRSLITVGFVAIAVLFLMYSRYQNPELLTPDSIEAVMRIAYAFYILFFLALGAIAYGIHLYLHQRIAGGGKLVRTIEMAMYSSRGKKIWITTFVIYGVLFSLSSGTLIYQPEVIFSEAYGADIPSGFIAPCCDEPGYMPAIIIYLTEHIGLQIIPINLLLQIIVSYLVALNISLAIVAVSLSKKSRGVGTMGAATGLFIACPTCAGTFLSLFLGTASGLSAVFVITQLQTVFIAVTIPVLCVIPFIIAKRLDLNDSCRIDTE